MKNFRNKKAGEEMNHEKEKVIIVGCQLPHVDSYRFQNSMDELASLTDTSGGTVILAVTQKRDRPDSALYLGKGKINELASIVEELEANAVIFNSELTPTQLRNLSDKLKVKVLDRTQLILDIFAQRAKSREGKLQIELAQLEYLLPRLSGKGIEMSRLGAGIGTRGPGETQLETDRRHIRKRITDIKHQLVNVEKHRDRYRERRKRNQNFQVALIGYTNAGKSTLFNRLAEADSLEENRLFATLDPLTRKMILPSGYKVLLSDTVGFIEDLPTTLIAAFRSTLEEAKEADLFLHVVDSSNPSYEQHEKVVYRLLKELDALNIPMITLYNKRDIKHPDFFPSNNSESILISAFNEEDLWKVKMAIENEMIRQMRPFNVKIPISEGRILAKLKEETVLRKLTFNEQGPWYECVGYIFPGQKLYGEIKQYMIGEGERDVT